MANTININSTKVEEIKNSIVSFFTKQKHSFADILVILFKLSLSYLVFAILLFFSVLVITPMKDFAKTQWLIILLSPIINVIYTQFRENLILNSLYQLIHLVGQTLVFQTSVQLFYF